MQPSNSWELQHLQQSLSYMACALALPKVTLCSPWHGAICQCLMATHLEWQSGHTGMNQRSIPPHDFSLICTTKGVQCMYSCHLRNLLPRMRIAVLQQSALASLLSPAKGANKNLRPIHMRRMAQPQPEAGAAR